MDDAEIQVCQDIDTATWCNLAIRRLFCLQFDNVSRFHRHKRHNAVIPAAVRLLLCQPVLNIQHDDSPPNKKTDSVIPPGKPCCSLPEIWARRGLRTSR